MSSQGPESWSVGLQVMLEKIAGVWVVKKLQVIQLYESLMVTLADKVADMSATCRPDSQMSALLAEMPLSRRHNFDPDTFFCVGICRHPPNFPLYGSTKGTYGEFLCKFLYVGYGWGSREILLVSDNAKKIRLSHDEK